MKKYLFTLLGTAISMTAMAETVESWELPLGPDGKTWSVITISDMVNLGNEYYDDLRYNTMKVTVSDASHQEVGSFTVDVSGLNANSLFITGPITQHLFNNDDQYEIGVQLHIPGNASNNYTSRMLFRAYSFDGTLVMETEESQGNGMINVAPNGAQSFAVEELNDATGTCSYLVFTNNGEGPTLAHTFSVSYEQTNYMAGFRFNAFPMEDGLHYLFCHYEKSYCVLDEWGNEVYDPMTWMPLITPDNHFIIEHFNQDFEKIDELSVSTDLPEGVMMRTMGCLGINFDLTRGYFSGDDRYNYGLFFSDMDQHWNDVSTRSFYAQGNELLGSLSSTFAMKLSDIEGEPEQWVTLKVNDMGEQYLSLVQIPSFTEVAQIPASLDDKLISTNIGRIADPAEGYKYIIGLNEPAIDADLNVIAQYGIYHKDFTVDDYVLVNMGPNAELFEPLIIDETLDPHLFNSDDQREFIFLTKIKEADNKLYDAIFVANESGEVIQVISSYNKFKGNSIGASIINYGTDHPELFVSYNDYDTSSSYIEFYALPLGATGIQQLSNSVLSDRIFNLQGQHTQTTTPGLYIRNGQKVSLGR